MTLRPKLVGRERLSRIGVARLGCWTSGSEGGGRSLVRLNLADGACLKDPTRALHRRWPRAASHGRVAIAGVSRAVAVSRTSPTGNAKVVSLRRAASAHDPSDVADRPARERCRSARSSFVGCVSHLGLPKGSSPAGPGRAGLAVQRGTEGDDARRPPRRAWRRRSACAATASPTYSSAGRTMNAGRTIHLRRRRPGR